MSDDDLVTVYSLQDAMTAEIIKNYLESEGLFCAVANQHQGGFTGIFSIEILVRSEDADRAAQLIEAQRKSMPTEEDAEEESRGDADEMESDPPDDSNA